MNKFMPTHYTLLVLLAGSVIVILAAGPATLAQSPASNSITRSLVPYFTLPNSAQKAPDDNGFIRRWLLLEPIRQSSLRSNQQLTDSFVQASVKREYFPNQFTVIPKNGDKVTVDGTELAWHALDASIYDVKLYSFAYALNKPTYNVLFWAVTVIECPAEISGVRLSVGSNAASVWWVNDKEVIGIYGDRHMMIDDGVSKRLTLSKGPNVIRCAVINAPGVSDFCARFLDGQDKPITKGFTVNLSAAER